MLVAVMLIGGSSGPKTKQYVKRRQKCDNNAKITSETVYSRAKCQFISILSTLPYHGISRPDMIFKIGVHENSKIHRKTPVL